MVSFLGVGLDAAGLAWQAADPGIVAVTVFCLTMAGFLGLGSGAVFKMVPSEFPTRSARRPGSSAPPAASAASSRRW